MKNSMAVMLACWLMVASIFNDALADDGTKMVGTGTSTLKVDGPASVQVRMGDCRFSINLKNGEHIKYNDPDVIFYRAGASISDHELPSLNQAQTYAGYDWWFDKRGRSHVPWIGLMCENISDFKWSSSHEDSDISLESRDILNSNSLKCPADFNGKEWVRTSKTGNRFMRLDVEGAKGFVVDESSTGKKWNEDGSRFCFISESNVLIGISGDGLALSSKTGASTRSILDILRTFKF
jgi:hypothetical protein